MNNAELCSYPYETSDNHHFEEMVWGVVSGSYQIALLLCEKMR